MASVDSLQSISPDLFMHQFDLYDPTDILSGALPSSPLSGAGNPLSRQIAPQIQSRRRAPPMKSVFDDDDDDQRNLFWENWQQPVSTRAAGIDSTKRWDPYVAPARQSVQDLGMSTSLPVDVNIQREIEAQTNDWKNFIPPLGNTFPVLDGEEDTGKKLGGRRKQRSHSISSLGGRPGTPVRKVHNKVKKKRVRTFSLGDNDKPKDRGDQIRRHYAGKTCPTPGCNSRGHINPKFRSHFTVNGCPLVSRRSSRDSKTSTPQRESSPDTNGMEDDTHLEDDLFNVKFDDLDSSHDDYSSPPVTPTTKSMQRLEHLSIGSTSRPLFNQYEKKAQTHLVYPSHRGNQQYAKTSGIPDARTRVLVMESGTSRVLSGAAAPSLKNLKSWIKKHPNWRVHPESVDIVWQGGYLPFGHPALQVPQQQQQQQQHQQRQQVDNNQRRQVVLGSSAPGGLSATLSSINPSYHQTPSGPSSSDCSSDIHDQSDLWDSTSSSDWTSLYQPGDDLFDFSGDTLGSSLPDIAFC